MTALKNWFRRRSLEDESSYAWEHNETGEIVWVTEKIVDEGYYLRVCRPGKWDSRVVNSRDLCHYPVKALAKKSAVQKCRENPSGFFHDM